MKTIFIIAIIIGISYSFGFSQCNYSLLDSAKKDMGATTYLKHFKIRFAKPHRKRKISVANFSVYLSKGNTYLFVSRNDKTQKGRAIVKLYDDFSYFGGNVNPKTSEIKKSFGFYCQKTGVYYLTIRFNDRNPGCAVVLLALKSKRKSKYAWGKK